MALAYYVNLVGAGFFNFALGADAMAAALGASWLVQVHGFPVWSAVIVAIAGALLISAFTELAVVRPVQARSKRPGPRLRRELG
jgi:branched-chain amino acid transport system permease protein